LQASAKDHSSPGQAFEGGRPDSPLIVWGGMY
jgi:hypothetical protein